ncbi:MAG: hypothetical protein HOI17_00625, partial [Alphaproteobacteria bacterium]|nr:hypothetical protein [Alphaproteobacteria bacterium]
MPKTISYSTISFIRWGVLILGLSLALAACGNIETSRYEAPKDPYDTGSFITGKDEAGISLSGLLNPKISGTGSMPVNALLWR